MNFVYNSIAGDYCRDADIPRLVDNYMNYLNSANKTITVGQYSIFLQFVKAIKATTTPLPTHLKFHYYNSSTGNNVRFETQKVLDDPNSLAKEYWRINANLM